MSNHDIINSWELVQTERERWADKLAPKHIPGDDCCTYSCTGGHGCPVRQTPINKAPAPKWCERAKQPCTTPYTCSPLCRLITTHRKTDGLPIQMIKPPRWYRRPVSLYAFATVGACICFALALYQTF